MRKTSPALILLAIFHSCVSDAAEDKTIHYKPIQVTASRISRDNEFSTARSVDASEGADLAGTLVDRRTRGAKGVQEDISMRAATFEEALVLLDGVRMNDPQTGHFTMDIPVTNFDIARQDIVYGPSSGYYGSSGMGGTLNIERAPLSDKVKFRSQVEAGGYDYYSTGVSLDAPVGEIKNRFSFEGSRSSGYMAETEFDRLAMTANTQVPFDSGYIDFMYGELIKNFGADSFYSDIYKNEEEHTDTRLFKLDMGYAGLGVFIRPILYFRRHWDKFILDRNREDFSKNFHKNYVYGGELSAEMDTPFGSIAYGFDMEGEEIDSTSLMKHKRSRSAVFLENRLDLKKWLFEAGLRFDRYSSFGWEFNPDIGAAYFINDKFKLRASAGRAFRAPSFTELYYETPANAGNPELKPEHSMSFDAGCDYKEKYFDAQFTYFIRWSDDVIDWTRTSSSTVWQAENIGEFDVFGFESALKYYPKDVPGCRNLRNVYIKYGYTEAFEARNVVSKYVLNYLMHNLTAGIEYETIYGFVHRIGFSLKKRVGDEIYALVDTSLSKEITAGKARCVFYVDAENLFNTDYSEVGGVRQPGIWVVSGIKFEI